MEVAAPVTVFNYDHAIFGHEKISLNQTDHPGYINFIRLIPILKSLPPDARILDLGCGGGGLLASLQAIRPELDYTGIDISTDAIRYAQQNYPQINFTVSTAHQTHLQKSNFDLIIISEVLEHVAEYKEVLEETHSLLKKNGILYLTIPLERSLFTLQGIGLLFFHQTLSHYTTGHINYFNKKELTTLLKEKKFIIEKYTYSQHLLWQIAATIYQFIALISNKNITEMRTSLKKNQSLLTGTIASITNFESQLLQHIPGSDMQCICKVIK